MKPRSKSTETTVTPATKRPRATLATKPIRVRENPSTTNSPEAIEEVRITTKEVLSSKISPDEISRRAHEIWLREGQPEGRHLEHWYQAERELQKERQG